MNQLHKCNGVSGPLSNIESKGLEFGKNDQLQKHNIINGSLRNMEREGFVKKANMSQPQKYNILNICLSYIISWIGFVS